MGDVMTRRVAVPDEEALVGLGRRFGAALSAPLVIFLNGELGAGKTTLARGVLRAFGHEGAVKSPTYTLVEPYALDEQSFYHFDLYRLGDPEELEFMGIRDYFSEGSIALVEWPERGRGALPNPDVSVVITVTDNGRDVAFEAITPRGVECLGRLETTPETE